MSEHETHPADEGHDAGVDRRVEEEAQRYPRHEDPDEAREDVGLRDDGDWLQLGGGVLGLGRRLGHEPRSCPVASRALYPPSARAWRNWQTRRV